MKDSNSGESEKIVPTPWRRVRPLWRTAALTVATINLYWFYWFWATWRELKQETGDNRMRPFGHMLSLFVPVYQLFRIHAHFRAIRELVVQRSEVKSVGLAPLSPGVALVLALVGAFLIRLSADLSFKPGYVDSPWWHEKRPFSPRESSRVSCLSKWPSARLIRPRLRLSYKRILLSVPISYLDRPWSFLGRIPS